MILFFYIDNIICNRVICAIAAIADKNEGGGYINHKTKETIIDRGRINALILLYSYNYSAFSYK